MKALLFNASTRLAKIAMQSVLGVAILGWVIEHSESSRGEVVVHVMEADVEVTIGGNDYVIRGMEDRPIVCELPVGRHDLVMRRGGRVLYEESFDLHGGEVRVLTAWDRDRRRGFDSMRGLRAPDRRNGVVLGVVRSERGVYPPAANSAAPPSTASGSLRCARHPAESSPGTRSV